jgi:alpha,alpha-trehalase
LSEHIVALWPQLTRAPLAADAHSSQLPLAHPYVVPGGRFREMYYWDSYFTMLGLVRDGHQDTTASMVDDFAGLLARYGHIPNGTRSYYLSRSQPPVFYLMVALLSADSADAWARYLPSLRAEYAYWMAGERWLRPGKATRNVVALPGGAILNRYWDALATPRDESYREDVALAAQAAHDGRAPASLYRDLRAAAESGWDFSSRWLRDPGSLASIETTAIVPVDLNSLLYGLERAISQGCARRGDGACAREFERRATARRAAITRYLWDARGARYLDYQWQRGEQIARPSAAMLYPLFTGVADAQQGQGVADAVRRDLLAPGGVLATPLRTGQQWDAPNGWAPLQWIAVQGLRDYGERELAQEIATRWLRTVARGYDESGRLLEKYDVLESRPGGGGEYPLQDGFGWTNGVTRALLDEAPLR